jgi:alpha-1,3-glucosyltransferase
MIDHVAVAILLITTGLKILLIPAYHSTDFEVHRNWLAITHSKPWQEWYTDEASPSEWTLDYPPLFAWMEYCLSHIAKFFDPAMLDVNNLNYASRETIRFQRYSVLFTEGLLLAVTWWVTRCWPACRRRLALFLVAANPGIIIVDHIHFQYNGILLGIFVLSIWTVASGFEILGAALFAALLCFKHIFLYAAPAFFVFLLRYYCRGSKQVAISRFISLGIVVLTIFLLSLGPFIFSAGQGVQLAQRMFPVSRGLLHAYWAPNFWALYAAADKLLAMILPCFEKFPFLVNLLPKLNAAAGTISSTKATLTGGLVGEASFTILLNISSSMTMLCVLCSMLPCLISTWRRPLAGRFARAAVHATLTAYMFGYHVHEKAILMPLIPLALLAAGGTDSEAPREFAFLSIVGTYSLFPLLIRNEEYGIKILLLVVYLSIGLPWLQDLEYWTELGRLTLYAAGKEQEEEEERRNGARGGGSKKSAASFPPSFSSRNSRYIVLFSSIESIYLWGLVPLELYCLVGHKLLFGQSNKLPFLPLLLTSVYCAAGNMYCWLKMTRRYCTELLGNTSDKKKKKKRSGKSAVQDQESSKGNVATARGRAGGGNVMLFQD